MKKIAYILMLAMALVLICACGQEEEIHEGTQILIYYKDTSDSKLVSKPYYLKSVETKDILVELLDVLSTNPSDKTVMSALSEFVSVTDMSFGKDGQLIIDFAPKYLEMETITEIFCRAAIVRTLCQVEGVDHVEFYVGGQSLILSGDQPVGQMTASDFIDNTGGYTELTQTTYVTVYFANETGDKLNDIHIMIENDGSKSFEQLVVEQLIAGPENILGADNVYPVIPEGTVLNKITTKDGICYVDMNLKFTEKREEITEEVAIYSIVNSLCELTNVSKVQITVEGENDKQIGGTSLNGLFERNLALISD